MTLKQYLDLVPCAHHDRPRFTAFLSAVLEQVLDLEDLRLQLPSALGLSTASGVCLDTLGAYLRCPRGRNRTDPDYRLQLCGRILQHRWDGTAASLKALLELYFPDFHFRVSDEENLSMTVQAPASMSAARKTLLETHQLIPKLPGIKVNYEYI